MCGGARSRIRGTAVCVQGVREKCTRHRVLLSSAGALECTEQVDAVAERVGPAPIVRSCARSRCARDPPHAGTLSLARRGGGGGAQVDLTAEERAARDAVALPYEHQVRPAAAAARCRAAAASSSSEQQQQQQQCARATVALMRCVCVGRASHDTRARGAPPRRRRQRAPRRRRC